MFQGHVLLSLIVRKVLSLLRLAYSKDGPVLELVCERINEYVLCLLVVCVMIHVQISQYGMIRLLGKVKILPRAF